MRARTLYFATGVALMGGALLALVYTKGPAGLGLGGADGPVAVRGGRTFAPNAPGSSEGGVRFGIARSRAQAGGASEGKGAGKSTRTGAPGGGGASGGAGADQAPRNPRTGSSGSRPTGGGLVVGSGGRSGTDKILRKDAAKKLRHTIDSLNDVFLEDDDEELDEEEEPEIAPGTGLLGQYWKLIDEYIGDIQEPRGEPTLVRVDPAIDFPVTGSFGFPFRARNFRARWTGFLRVREGEDGPYAFILGSDDGSRLTIDGQRLINVNKLQPYHEATTEVYLAEGLHSIDVYMIQNEGPCACVLTWVPPGGIPTVVPTEVLYPADRVSVKEVPRIDSATPPVGHRDQAVTLRGAGFPEPGEPFELLFGGRVLADARYIDDESGPGIVATIPPGVDVGDFTLKTGGAASAGFRYEVEDVFGLLCS
ncbi:MAG: PA14 domain-containing protein, partial [Planctomycetota bacterium]